MSKKGGTGSGSYGKVPPSQPKAPTGTGDKGGAGVTPAPQPTPPPAKK